MNELILILSICLFYFSPWLNNTGPEAMMQESENAGPVSDNEIPRGNDAGPGSPGSDNPGPGSDNVGPGKQ